MEEECDVYVQEIVTEMYPWQRFSFTLDRPLKKRYLNFITTADKIDNVLCKLKKTYALVY